MVTGQLPYDEKKTEFDLFNLIVNEQFPNPKEFYVGVSDEMCKIIQKATAKDPAQRYGDTLEFANAFLEAARLHVHPLGESVVELITTREQEVLKLMMNNLSNKEIAERLVVSVNTVKYFQKQIYSKLRVRNRVQAMTRARELDLIFGNADNGTRVISSTSMMAQLPEPMPA